METTLLLLLLALAPLCLTIRAEAEPLTFAWDFVGDPGPLERFQLWRTSGTCPPATLPATPVASVPPFDLRGQPVREMQDPTAPTTGMACWTLTATRAQLPATPTWTPCATEGQSCAVRWRPQVVRYGTNGTYAYLTTSTPTLCAAAVFGDAVWGYVKTCDVAPALGPATVSDPSNAVQQPTSGIMPPTGFRLVPQ